MIVLFPFDRRGTRCLQCSNSRMFMQVLRLYLFVALLPVVLKAWGLLPWTWWLCTCPLWLPPAALGLGLWCVLLGIAEDFDHFDSQKGGAA